MYRKLGFKISAFFALLGVTLLAPTFALSADPTPPNIVKLYEPDGSPHPSYDTLALRLKTNEILIFPDGSKFRIINRLGSGATTLVFEVAVVELANESRLKPEFQFKPDDRFALRIPIKTGIITTGDLAGETYESYIDHSFENAAILEKTGVVPKFFAKFGKKFLLVQKINETMSLTNFLKNYDQLSETQRIQLTKSFYEFAKAFAPFLVISDFKPQQIVLEDNKHWKLLDWTEGLMFYENIKNLMVISKSHPLNSDFFIKMLKTIYGSEGIPHSVKKLFENVNDVIQVERQRYLEQGINPISKNPILHPSNKKHSFQVWHFIQCILLNLKSPSP